MLGARQYSCMRIQRTEEQPDHHSRRHGAASHPLLWKIDGTPVATSPYLHQLDHSGTRHQAILKKTILNVIIYI